MEQRDESGGSIIIADQSNQLDALRFLQEWTKSLVAFMTLALGAIGGFLQYKVGLQLSVVEKVFLIVCLVALGAALICAGFVLFMLPGVAQRKHTRPDKDLYSISTYGSLPLGFWAMALWGAFLLSVISFIAFVIVRIRSMPTDQPVNPQKTSISAVEVIQTEHRWHPPGTVCFSEAMIAGVLEPGGRGEQVTLKSSAVRMR